jgi:hypothetical protein
MTKKKSRGGSYRRKTVEARQFYYPCSSDTSFQFIEHFQDLIPHVRFETGSELFPQLVLLDHLENIAQILRSDFIALNRSDSLWLDEEGHLPSR